MIALVPEPFLPLRGVQVVDLTISLAGPLCTEILAALGADVVKIEHPERGDDTRAWGPPFWDGDGVLFLSANAGKRSLALDVKAPPGREALLRLVDRADVFVQSLRPGHAERLGLGAAELRARNPRLVHCSIGAFGREGPLRDEPGYDPLMQAFAGIMSVTGEPDRPGVRVGVSLVDQGTGLWAALAIVAALHAGGGRTIDVSLYETAIGLMSYHLAAYAAAGQVPGRHGTAFPLIVPYEVFPTKDGELMIAAGSDRLFANLCGALELPVEERFATNPQRVERRDELVELLSGRLREAPTAAWLDRLSAAGVPAAPVQDSADVTGHEQTRALGILQELAGLPVAALPVSADDERVLHRAPPPGLGQHSAEVLGELGYTDGEIGDLVAAGLVRVAR